MIRCVEVVPGLKINLYKSRLFGVGAIENIGKLADCIGCSVGSLPTTHLGILLGVPYKSSSTWNPGVDHIQKRLVDVGYKL